jgi:hypothetical protein
MLQLELTLHFYSLADPALLQLEGNPTVLYLELTLQCTSLSCPYNTPA